MGHEEELPYKFHINADHQEEVQGANRTDLWRNLTLSMVQ
jgi:hypothetical protein